MYFVIAPTTGGHSWWLIDDQGAIAGEAGVSFPREADALIAARFFQRRTPSMDLVVHATADGRFRWEATRGNHVLAISHSSYDTREAAVLVALIVKNAVPSALGL
jgi:hypothetical protein